MKFDGLIIDEGHRLRNYKTKQSQAVFRLGKQSKTRFVLTGTPVSKHDSEIFGILHFLNPKKYPSYWNFVSRYFEVDDNRWGGKEIGKVKTYRQQELLSVMDEMSTLRKRKDHMQWLPKAQKQTIYVKMEPKQLKLYDQMVETFTATDGDIEVDTMNKLVQLTRLRQLCIDPRMLGFEKVMGAKTTALLEFAENNEEPFIVMTTFSSYFKIIKSELEKLGKKVGIIDGSVSQKEKFATAERFQNGNYDILLCNIIAAGTGFTLDRAETILFLDKDFNPSNNEQAQDRIVPTTKDRYHNINIISLVVAGSIDERVDTILENKEDLTKLINKREVFV